MDANGKRHPWPKGGVGASNMTQSDPDKDIKEKQEPTG